MTDEEAKAKKLANLKPYPKGVSGNKKGRPKGIKNWSTIVQQLLADETLVDKIVGTKPSYWDHLPNKNAANAIVVTMMINAMNGDQKSAEWLRKSGFGDKLTHGLEDSLFQATKIEIEIVKPKSITKRNAES